MNYLFLDTESGGLSLETSLLSAYFLVMDKQFNKKDELLLNVIPDDGKLILTTQGMLVNKINIVNHIKTAIPYKDAKPILYNFLKKYTDKDFLVPVGHGIKGDITKICNYILSQGSWDQFCSYITIDTGSLFQYYAALDMIPSDLDGNVETLAKYFKININFDKLHEAEEDTRLTMEIYKKFIIMGERKNG